MIKLLAYIPETEDGTSYYRAAWPLKYLKKIAPDIDVVINPEILPNAQNVLRSSTFVDADVVFMQRPCNDFHLAIVQTAKEMGIPVWVDVDDDLFSVPNDNPMYSTYSNPKTRLLMQACLQLADLISCSTLALCDVVNTITGSDKARHVPNAFDDYGPLLERRKVLPRDNNSISWRGGRTHTKDLMRYSKEIWSIAERNTNLNWHFFGDPTWQIADNESFKNCKQYSHQNILSYMGLFQTIAPKVHMVPLWDCPFNRAKSNIAWIEATYAGALTLAPRWDSWCESRIATYVDGETFVDAMNRALDMPNSIQDNVVKEDWNYIRDCLSVSKINHRRAEIVRDLADLS